MSELCLLDAKTKLGELAHPTGNKNRSASDSIDPIRSFGEVLDLGFDEFIFRAGDPKTHVYRLESGIVFLCANSHGSPTDIMCPGDYLGLGFLKTHTHSARIVLSSRVRAIPLDELPQLIARDPGIKNQLDMATEREFEAHRMALVSSVPDSHLSRVAGFLVAISHLNARQGADPQVVDDTLSCGAVAEWLSMDVDTLANQLIDLRRRGLIDYQEPGRLFLRNISGLEAALVNGSPVGSPL